jgi:hypothetical protein
LPQQLLVRDKTMLFQWIEFSIYMWGIHYSLKSIEGIICIFCLEVKYSSSILLLWAHVC